MSTPTPLASSIGGIGLALPVHSLALLNGSVFGISGSSNYRISIPSSSRTGTGNARKGFVHRAAKGNYEALVATLGLISGGMIVGAIEGTGPASDSVPLFNLIFSGYLVGLGTKLSNGCTSGHMLAGLSRLSSRSFAATSTFFVTAVLTARALHSRTFSPIGIPDWSLSSTDKILIGAQLIPQLVSVLLYAHASMATMNTRTSSPPRPVARLAALLSTTVAFALALRSSNMTDPKKVLSFLLLPVDSAFDPSLAFLAIGALPLGIVLYHFFRGSERPALGGAWNIPKPGQVDTKLLIGSTIFGLGWGTSGFCPGPVLVNFGRAVVHGREVLPWLFWLCAFIAGGLGVN
ncbi:hypothetical protein D9757_003719 [Collybiopsis confluens]|uniref:YeeE/YedE family protein n=1 Tax=Collybiopsis confluens TaxID=2823264 RepID=A0A8H5MCZ7_9AGAR|nr:hypothetical protein D9757_003719 [Collybiopsis confluens]